MARAGGLVFIGRHKYFGDRGEGGKKSERTSFQGVRERYAEERGEL